MSRGFWLLFAATIAVYAVIVGWSLPGVAAEAGGLMPFDLRPGGYSFDEAQDFLTALSDVGRERYLGVQHTLDTAYPAMLALVLVQAAYKVLHKPWQGAAVALALTGMLGDYLENFRVAGMLMAAPEAVTEEMVSAASTATLIKSLAGGLAMTLVLVGAARSIWRHWRGEGA